MPSEKKYNLLNLLLKEVSLVDNPANKGAKVVMFKRASGFEALVKALEEVDSEDPVTFSNALVEHLRMQEEQELFEKPWPLVDALRESVFNAVRELSGQERLDTIASNAEMFLQAASATLAKAESIATEMVSKRHGLSDYDALVQAIEFVLKGDDTGGNNMNIDELKKNLDTANGQISTLKTEVSKLSGANSILLASVQSLIKSLDGAGFTVELDEANKVVKCEKRAEPEMIDFNGTLIRKDSLPEPVLKELEESRIERVTTKLTKRGEEELPHLSGSALLKGKLLDFIDGLGEDESKEMVSALKAADTAVSKLFEQVGHNPSHDADSPQAKLDDLVAKHAQEHGVSTHQAFASVTKVGEGRELLKQISKEKAAH